MVKYIRNIKENTFTPSYIYAKTHFKWIQLKFRIRVGVSGIGEEINRQHRGAGRCIHCDTFETVKHFVLNCSAYDTERQTMFRNIKDNINDTIFSNFICNQDLALDMLLGDHDDIFNNQFLQFLSNAWKRRITFNSE